MQHSSNENQPFGRLGYFQLSLAIAALFAASFQIQAQTTVTLNPVLDNTLYESATGHLSNGKGTGMFVGKTNTGLIRRAVVKFDVANGLPANATITDAYLVLNMNKTISGASNIGIHRISADWGEGNSNAGGNEGTGIAAQTGDATWIHRFYQTSNWSTVGGDFASTASATTSVSSIGSYTWSSGQVITDVQNWFAEPSTNFGWIVKGNESVNTTAKRFATREFPTVADRPKLVITYTTPCIDPIIDTFEASTTSICPGESATLTVTGSLNSATGWQLYAISCGGTNLENNTSGVFEVSPVATTKYYVRGMGGCVTPGSCKAVTITVLDMDDPSFHYDANAYCENDSDPAPTITGDGGGTFSSNPAGLSLNTSTGAIDLSASTIGEYLVTYTTNIQCSNSEEHTVIINATKQATTSTSICEGETYSFGAQMLTASGMYMETFQSVAGCDSVVTLTLSVIQKVASSASVTICEGEEYTFGTQVLTTTGMFNETFVSALGCDSVVTLTLTVVENVSSSVSATICDGEEYILGTQTLTTTGLYMETFQSAAGCDSVVTLTLSVFEEVLSSESATICEGEEYVLGTQTLTTSGTFMETFQSAQGCDSIVTLTLSVFEEVASAASAVICEGDEYILGTQTLTSPGVFTEVFQSAVGCDSTVTLTLDVVTLFDVNVSAAICDGEEYVLGAQTLMTAGNYVETFQSKAGCDSVVHLNLDVLAVYNETAAESICAGEEYEFGTQTLTAAGVYDEIFTSRQGCDSLVTLTLSVNEVTSTVTLAGTTLSADEPGATYQWVDCTSVNSEIPGETGQSFTPATNGEYAAIITKNGCAVESPCTEVIVVSVEDGGKTGISIYPNPVSDLLLISGINTAKQVKVQVFDLVARSIPVEPNIVSDHIEINVSHLVPGLYIVDVETHGSATRLRFNKK